jgi:hypothetical protein
MVENTVSEDQYQSQFDNPMDEYERAKSDYLYVSRNYKNYYAVTGYIEAEQRAWERFEKAYRAIQELDA